MCKLACDFVHGLGTQPCAKDEDVTVVLTDHTTKHLVVWVDLFGQLYSIGSLTVSQGTLWYRPTSVGDKIKDIACLLLVSVANTRHDIVFMIVSFLPQPSQVCQVS